jgi:ribosomal protein S18 acetylase RimI-like enzyme
MRTHAAYELSDDPRRIDVEAVWEFLSTQAYWARWRGIDDVRAQVEGAWRVVGAYGRDGRLVGFARALSDGVSLAYLADVYVLPEHRGHGLGKALVDEMIEQGPGRDFRWMLHTDDAHGLCGGFGFAPPDARYLERQGRGHRARPPRS